MLLSKTIRLPETSEFYSTDLTIPVEIDNTTCVFTNEGKTYNFSVLPSARAILNAYSGPHTASIVQSMIFTKQQMIVLGLRL